MTARDENWVPPLTDDHHAASQGRSFDEEYKDTVEEHIDLYRVDYLAGTSALMERWNRDHADFEKYAARSGWDNGYVYWTPPHEDDECSKLAPGPFREVT